MNPISGRRLTDPINLKSAVILFTRNDMLFPAIKMYIY